MLQLPISVCFNWLDASGKACALQARSSVGLIHGIAHTLEPELTRAYPGEFWGHSRLCSLFLYPVLTFNRQSSPKCSKLCADFGVDFDEVIAVARNLFDAGAYHAARCLNSRGAGRPCFGIAARGQTCAWSPQSISIISGASRESVAGIVSVLRAPRHGIPR